MNILKEQAAARYVDAKTLQRWLSDGGEIALLDVREHGQYGEGHPFLAVSAPYSRLEIEAPALVPRRSTRTVVFDDGEPGRPVAVQAARRLAALGYTDVQVLAGGAPAWAATGRTLFKGVNVPSKTFGEQVEHAFQVPRIGADELHARLASGTPLVLLDGRTPAEHRKMTIPGALPVPNGELALRWTSVVPDPDVPIVVHCAGRTRSIVGAQILRELGLPNPVLALENGTQGWALAGHALERASKRSLPEPGSGARPAAAVAATMLSPAEAQAWLDAVQRTTFVFDVRTAAEFEAGTLSGARHAPGGQLIQATDLWIGVRGSRVLVLDDDGLRAPVIALWLYRLGFEAAAVEGGIHAPLHVPAAPTTAVAQCPLIDAASMAELAREASARSILVFDLQPSQRYRQRHAKGARWSIRPRIVADATANTSDRDHPVLLLSDAADIAALAAAELRDAGYANVTWADVRTAEAAGWAQEATPDTPSDADSIDFLFFVHDRHDGNLDAAQRYLEWETGLLAQCAPDELAVFRLRPIGGR